MTEVFQEISNALLSTYQGINSILPVFAQNFFKFLLIALLIVVYSIFVWKFYQSVSRKNLVKLNLNQYNKVEHSGLAKLLAVVFYFFEYLLILPFFIFLWFAFLTLFLIFLNEGLSTSALLIISGTLITAIRITSYYKEDLAKDIAKLIPFTLLGIFLLSPDFFSIERILGVFSEIPLLFEQIFFYFLLIFIIELVLRIFSFIFGFFQVEEKS